MIWSQIVAVVKAWNLTAGIAQKFVHAWQVAQLSEINNKYDARREEREAIIWAMEKAREFKDTAKLRALNRQLAVLDASGELSTRSVQ